MPLVATPITAPAAAWATAYLTAAAARLLAASLPQDANMTALLALDDAGLGAQLLAATLDLDAAGPYQGAKYLSTQEHEFPRVTGESVVSGQSLVVASLAGGEVWDWDATANVAIVPPLVEAACVLQAAHLMDAAFAGRLAAVRSGLAAQSIGTASETYLKPAELLAIGGTTGLAERVARMMERYRLRTGRLL